MAEVLGAVASGIAVAQLGGQLIKCIKKLKDFRDQVEGVDSDIQHQILQLDVLFRTLDSMQTQSKDVPLPTECFDLCRAGADKLSELIDEYALKLKERTGLKRKAASVKFVLKKDDLETLKKRLHESIQLLQLACNLQTNAMLQKNAAMMSMLQTMMQMHPSMIAAEFSKSMINSNTTKAQTSTTSTQSSVVTAGLQDTAYNYFTWAVGSLNFTSIERGLSTKPKKYVQAYYKAPSWYSRKIWEIVGRQTSSGWLFSFSTYREIPENSPFFNAIKAGNIAEVQRMLGSKEALISDREYGDYTALHVAAEAENYDMCNLLVREGASVLARDFRGITPLHQLAWTREQTAQGLDTARLLINAGAIEVLIDDCSIFNCFSRDTDFFQYLQRQMFPPYDQLPSAHRFNIVASLLQRVFFDKSEDVIALALGREDQCQDLIELVCEDGRTLLHHAAIGIGCSRSQIDYVTNPEGGLRVQLRKLVSMGLRVNAIDNDGRTALYFLVFAYFLCFIATDGRFVDIVQAFLTDLSMAGIDLEEYGDIERRQMAKCNTNFGINWMRACTTLISFEFGPRPEDWVFWFSEPTDEFAGEFWELVEGFEQKILDENKTEFNVPGAWNDD